MSIYHADCLHLVVGYEAVQKKLHALRNRQNLFQEEGMIALVLDTIDQFSMYKSPRHFAYYAGEEATTLYEEISSYLYLLLGELFNRDISTFYKVLEIFIL